MTFTLDYYFCYLNKSLFKILYQNLIPKFYTLLSAVICAS